jgi:transcriptional regulator with XRE-family HTH domain
LRQDRGWTQTALAERLGTTVKMVTYYEREAQNPTRKTIERVAMVFGVPISELMGGGSRERSGKPGPPSRWLPLIQRLSRLPKGQQQVVERMLEGFLQQAGKAR